MADLIAINPKLHATLRIAPDKAELHSRGIQLLPVVPAEFASIATQSPIVLTKNGQTGQFVTVAMLGFAPGENLWFADGRWQGAYLPLQLQRQPFFLGQSGDNGQGDYVLCIDPDSPALVQDHSAALVLDQSPALDATECTETLFNDTGADSAYLQQIKGVLAELLQGEQQQQQLVQALLAANLMQPLSLEITFANQQSTRLNGLYTIDQQKLAALDAATLIQLHQAGWLAPIYTIIASAAQLYPLIARKNQQLTGAA
jgi:hypothetical protein